MNLSARRRPRAPWPAAGGRARGARPRRRARCAWRARGARGAQGEGRLAALDLDRPRPRHEPVDQVAGTDLQVAPLVDGVAVLDRAGCALGAWRRRRAGRCRRPPAGAAGPASRGRAAARRAGRRARGRPRPRSARAPRRGARTPRAPAAYAIRSSPRRRRAPAGPNARRWRRTTSSSALSPFGAPRGRGAASRALGAFVPQAPSAGTRTKADQRWNGRHLSSRWRSSSAVESALGWSASHSSTKAPISSALRGVRLA